jgi:hypothetical protein
VVYSIVALLLVAPLRKSSTLQLREPQRPTHTQHTSIHFHDGQTRGCTEIIYKKKQTLQQRNNIFDYCVGLIISSVASSSLADCSSLLSLLLLFVFSLVSCVTSCSTTYVVLIEQQDEEREEGERFT